MIYREGDLRAGLINGLVLSIPFWTIVIGLLVR